MCHSRIQKLRANKISAYSCHPRTSDDSPNGVSRERGSPLGSGPSQDVATFEDGIEQERTRHSASDAGISAHHHKSEAPASAEDKGGFRRRKPPDVFAEIAKQ